MLLHVSGARPSTTYTATLLAPNGTSSSPLGSAGPTNKAGGATLVTDPAFSPSTIASGEVVLQSGGANEFVSGFKVDQKFKSPKVSGSTFQPCASVTYPAPLGNCGSDPLDSGSYKVEAGGQVSVTLAGASPSANYELFLRPLDNSGDIDTGIGVPTNALGDARTGAKAFFPAKMIASGTFVLKNPSEDSTDQFVAGYQIQ